MTKSTLLALATSAVLAAACGASTPTDSAAQGGPAASPAPPVDAHLIARQKLESKGGMWMPRQMVDQAGQLAELGLEIEPARLSDPTRPPLSAVVNLGGCTASFVSPEGLVVTNHHCVQGALQFNSTPALNLVEEGFLARTRDDERWAGPTQRIRVAQKITDITRSITDGLAAITDPRARHDEIEKREKAALAACEKDRPGIRCDVRSFLGGAEWQLTESLEIRDVRLVYVPHRAIGAYGGEIDNWSWPRHSGDFAFYRAYVGKDGKPADHAPENVPYKPPAFLKVQPAGVAAHDLVMVTGYPGRTNRHQTAAEMRHAAEWTHPRYIEKAHQKMAVLAELQKQPGETAIKAGVARQGTQNGLEKYEGILEGLKKYDLVRAKDRAEAEFRAWASADPSRKRYLDAMAGVEAILERTWKANADDERWDDAMSGSTLLTQARFLVKWSHEQAKQDIDRQRGFQERDRSIVVGQQRAFGKRFDPVIDRALWKLTLMRAAADPASKSWLPRLLRLPASARIDEAAIDRALQRFYSRTRLADLETRTKLLAASPADLRRSTDPFIVAALAQYPRAEEDEARSDAWYGELILLRPVYMQGLVEKSAGKLAPDANGTLRISYGTVRGYRPDEGKEAYVPFTSAADIPEKNTGEKPFNAPKKLLDAIAKGSWGPYAQSGLGAAPVAFLSDLDITGGNSGSPVLNARGELIGLAFDGNYEGLASDVVFTGATTRSISVDVRYVLWVADAVDQADHVITELGLTPSL